MAEKRSSSKKRNGTRDTAKDIILGLAPSGKAPRKPKEGVAQIPVRKVRSITPNQTPIKRSATITSDPGYSHYRAPSTQKSRTPPQTIVVQKQDNSVLQNLQNQIHQLRKQQNDLINSEAAARRKLQESQDVLYRKLTAATANGQNNRALEDLKRQLHAMEIKMGQMNQDMGSVRGTLDKHGQDLMSVNHDVKNRPVIDPNKLEKSTQQLDIRLRDMHGQLAQVKQSIDTEINERIRINQQQNDTIVRLQDYIKQQEANKNDILNNLSRKGDMDKEKLNEESRRLNDKIQLITAEVAKNMNDREQRLKDDLNQKLNALQNAMKQQQDGIKESDAERKNQLDVQLHEQEKMIEELRAANQSDRAKNKEKFQKVNEALASLEKHLESGNKKMDKILNAEIQSRKLHEKGLLSKVNDIEEKLSNYLTGLSKSVEEAKAGKENVKVPTLDTDALRREMEAISADKNKMSMEGLLKLEEKISRIQHGLNKDRRAMVDTLNDMNDKEQINKIRAQVNKLDEVMDDVEKTQDRVRDKVERQIPQDLNELSSKVDNLKQQLTHRIDQEEEERYLAIKELQEAYNKVTTGASVPGAAGRENGADSAYLKRDIDECKVAVKKLAESISTVKNVLDKKVQDEVRKREQEIERLQNRISQRQQYPPQQQYPTQQR